MSLGWAVLAAVPWVLFPPLAMLRVGRSRSLSDELASLPALPPLPSSKHVIVVNSAQNAPRHHGIAGMFQRLHQWHMRTRAKLYRAFNR